MRSNVRVPDGQSLGTGPGPPGGLPAAPGHGHGPPFCPSLSRLVRIGFAHQYQPLDADDIPTVLAQYWQQLGQPFDNDNADHTETANAVKQITGGTSASSNAS